MASQDDHTNRSKTINGDHNGNNQADRCLELGKLKPTKTAATMKDGEKDDRNSREDDVKSSSRGRKRSKRDDDEDEDDDGKDHRKKKSSSKSHKKHSSSSSKSRSRSHNHKKKRRYSDDDSSGSGSSGGDNYSDQDSYSSSSESSSSSSSDDDDDDRHSKKKKSKSSSSSDKKRSKKDHKRKKDKKKKSKKSKSSKSSASAAAPSTSVPTFGQYGLIKSSDIHSNAKHQRSFQIWLEQIKGIPMQTSTLPKWELQNYFDEYREDFNTATLPHVKYYNYDEWEVQEYAREQQEREAGKTSNTGTGVDVHAEERQHALSLQQRAKQKVLEQDAITKALMSKEKVQDMKRRAELQSEMNHAFKRGDTEAYRRLQRRLEPDAK